MTRGPRRLMDDPDFQWETGCNLADESLQVGGYDLPGMKERLLAQIASAPPVTVGDGVPAVRAGSGWGGAYRPVIAAAVGAGLLMGAFWLGVRSGGDVSVDDPVPTHVAEPPSRGVAAVEVVPTPSLPSVAEPDEEPEPPDAAPPEPEPPASTPPVLEDPAAEAPDPIDTDGVSAVVEPAEPPVVDAPASSIAAQMALYEPAADALRDGRHAAAADGFRVYLAEWPAGDLRNEAELGLLQALFASGDAEGTAALAQTLQDRRALADRREDILRLRAESLLLLDRCDEALLVAEQLSSRAAAPVRRGCRSKRRDTP